MPELNEESDLLESLVDEFTQLCRKGERPSIDAYASRHPDLADEILELFPTIQAMEQAKQDSAQSSGRMRVGGEPPMDRLGDFRIIRELGRGGMGIVYEAEQESLGRRVAIKVLPRQHLSDRTRRERFEREARTAAKLHHTNIVPIFGVGEQDGYQYFVMQYIRGVGLDLIFRALTGSSAGPASGSARTFTIPDRASDLVRIARDLLNDSGSVTEPSSLDVAAPPAAAAENPSRQTTMDSRYWRGLASLIAQAADALAYAHAQRVLHRDMKPGNLLLDGDGSLWISDFGLAKAIDHGELTQAGDVVGTLRYMAPEQFKGHTDVRSDVYSLGVTLYELATLRPAFADARASSLVHAIMERPLVPPRQIRSSMPADLETIILKAAAREPAHRYASAADLRDDLHRFAEDRPITARRVSPVERLWRWSCRNPALATMTGLAFVLMFAVAAVSSAAYLRVRTANLAAFTALEGEKRQRQRAEITADLAVHALDAIFNEFAPQSGLASHELSLDDSDEYTVSVSAPIVLSQETAAFLEHMLDFYRRLGQQESSSPSVQQKVAAAQCKVGEIHERLGHYDEAKAAYADAIKRYETLLAMRPQAEPVATALARVHTRMAEVLYTEDSRPEASAHLETARGLLEAGGDIAARSPETRFEMARTWYLMAGPGGAMAGGKPPPSSPRGDRPRERSAGGSPETRGDRPPENRGDRPGEGREGNPPRGGPPGEGPREGRDAGPGQGPSRRDRDDSFMAGIRERRERLQKAVAILTPLSEQSPKVPEYRHLLATCLRELQPPPFRFRSSGEDEGQLERAVAILESLVKEHPQVPQYRFDLAETYAMQDRGPEGGAKLDQAIQILETLMREQPNVPSYAFSLAHICFRRSGAYAREGKDDAAIESLRRAVALQSKLAEASPRIVPYVMSAVFYETSLARALDMRKEPQQARPLLETAVARAEPILAAGDERPHVRMVAFFSRMQLADLYRRLGEEQLAAEVQKKADALKPEGWPWGRGPSTRPGEEGPPGDEPRRRGRR